MKNILIIGAGFLQCFVIKKAKELGYYTLTVDADPNAIGFSFADEYGVINIVDKEACLAYAQKKRVNGVLTAATDFGVQTAAYIASKLNLPGLSCETAQTVKNKYQTRKTLYEAKADDSEPGYEISEMGMLVNIENQLSYPVMVKPCDGSGSRGASRVSNPAELKRACLDAMSSSLSGKAVIEPFIEGKEYGVETFVYNGIPHVLAVMKKWMTKPPYYAELGHAIPSGLDEKTEKRIKSAAEKAVKALEINVGAVNMDVLVTSRGTVHIVDIGARMGGNLIGSHIIPIGTGYDYVENLIRAAAGDEVVLPQENTGKPIVSRLLALTPGTVAELPDFNKIENIYGVKVEHHLWVGDEITSYRTNLDGCGYIIAVSDSAEESLHKAEEALMVIDAAIKRI